MTDRRDREPSRRTTELAELDAGLVDGREADPAELRHHRAALDPRAVATLDALAATRAELAAAPPVPAPVAARQRWSALVQELHDAADDQPAAPAAPVVVPLRRRRVGLVAVAAAVTGAVLVTGVVTGSPGPRPLVTDASLVGVALAIRGVQDVGELDDPRARAACLAGVGLAGSEQAQLVAGRRVDFTGRPATVLVLSTGRLGVFDAVVVDDDCTELLARRRVP